MVLIRPSAVRQCSEFRRSQCWRIGRDMGMPEDVLGRQPFGKIVIANSDAGASAYSNVAIDQAHRAIAEILRS
jgi:hypothetical protein